ncbi:MAG TPA: alpha/beta hydrolase [Janthinobacterium sp.]|nr:alpha/beta hydrolase [Janthinobacterium sp.]
MTKPQLHFAHANSYPAGTYRHLFGLLGADFDVQALDMHAHNPGYPVETGWAALVEEYIDDLLARYTAPVILVGHSLGGMLSLMVAKARPDLVRCVVLLDSPVVAGWRALVLRLMRHSNIGERFFSPARFSERRRKLWPDAEAAYQHFASKEMFAIWAPDVLRDYIASGMAPHPEGVQLRFTREIESDVYRSLPHHIGTLVKGKFPVPIGFIGGSESAECRQAGLGPTRKLVGRFFRQVPGGHLFPMETPEVAARETKAMIEALLGPQG